MSVANSFAHRVGSVKASQTLWLPFLYQTRTILDSRRSHGSGITRPQHCAYTQSSARREQQRTESEERDVYKPFALDVDDPVPRGTQSSSTDDIPFINETPSSTIPQRPSHHVTPSRSSRTTVLPFVRPQKPKFGQGRVNETSSLTGSEARAFQALLGMQKKPDPNRPKDPNEPELSEIIGKAVGVEIPDDSSAQLSVDYINDNVRETMDPEKVKLKAAMNVIRSLLNDAQTDVRMWEILHENAINHVLSMKLDEDAPPPVASAGETKVEEMSVPHLTFPKSLVLFMKIIRMTFPTSPYGLALLPYLQRLGPSTFAYGATTELYNQHLQLLYEQRLDIRGMVDVLEDMHSKVFEFDTETTSIVQNVLDHASRMQTFNRSTSQNMFWNGKHINTNLRKLAAFKTVIENSIAENAIQQARSERLSTPTDGYLQKYGAANAV